MPDTLNLNETTYLTTLKNTSIDPLTKVILEQHKQIDNLAEGLSDDIETLWKAGAQLSDTRLLSNSDLRALLRASKKAGETSGERIGKSIGREQGALMTIGVIGIVAAFTAASVFVYKQYMSKAAKACKGSDNKKLCMAEYKVKALKAKAKTLAKNATVHCKKSKNPEKCYALTKQKLHKIQMSLKKIK